MALRNAALKPGSPAAAAAANDRFQLVTEAARRRLILSVTAMEKCGKTHFALTAPGPVGVINLDMGMEGVVQKFITQKQISVSRYRLKIPPRNSDIDLVASAASDLWEQLHADYRYALQNFRSTVIDTGDEAWAMLRLARFGKLDQVKPHHYGPVNAEYRDLFREADESDSNVIFLHKMKQIYLNDKATGDYERAGFTETGYLAQCELYLYRLPEDERTDPSDTGHRGLIKTCRQDPTLEGQVLVGDMLNFPTLAMMIFPDTVPEDWE